MGDVVLQTATINWLRSLLGKEARFTFVTSSEFVSLLDHHPEVNTVIGLDRKRGEKWKSLLHKIKLVHNNDPFDLIIDLHATLRSFRLKLSLWNIPALTVDKRRWERFFLTTIKNSRFKKILDLKLFGLLPQTERILKDFEGIFLDTQAKRRTINFRKGLHEELTSLSSGDLFSLPAPYVVIAPSASFESKRWPIDHFVLLAKKILSQTEFHVVILAGPDDLFCERFHEIGSDRLHNFQGKTTLKGSMGILAQSKLSIGNDSGMNHIAEAYGVACLTLFGPTDPRFGFAPHGSHSRHLSKEMFCKPCSTTGKKSCYRDRHYCMEEITVEEVFMNAIEILKSL